MGPHQCLDLLQQQQLHPYLQQEGLQMLAVHLGCLMGVLGLVHLWRKIWELQQTQDEQQQE
jgi:hypothetical protein